MNKKLEILLVLLILVIPTEGFSWNPISPVVKGAIHGFRAQENRQIYSSADFKNADCTSGAINFTPTNGKLIASNGMVFGTYELLDSESLLISFLATGRSVKMTPIRTKDTLSVFLGEQEFYRCDVSDSSPMDLGIYRIDWIIGFLCAVALGIFYHLIFVDRNSETKRVKSKGIRGTASVVALISLIFICLSIYEYPLILAVIFIGTNLVIGLITLTVTRKVIT